MKRTLIAIVFCSVITLSAGTFYSRGTPKTFEANLQFVKEEELPKKNAAIIKYIEDHGERIAPYYYKVVCTEFVIAVLEHFTPLTPKIKKDIRIITNEDLSTLIGNEADVIKGVQFALANAGIGTVVEDENVLAGDLVQFWNDSAWGAYGHCGFVVEVKVGEELTMYSSHPMTGGFGKQTFPWPEKVYFVRLN